MIHFDSDYLEGADKKILERLTQTNMEKTSGYGTDKYTLSAKDKILKLCKIENEGEVFFLSGGTQTNLTVISSLLNSFEGVICTSSGHINSHEAGAIENTGHKVIGIKHNNGKIDLDCLDEYMNDFYLDETYTHMVKPKLVYISYPSEYGTLYTKEELLNLRKICDKYNMYLYLDGARLGYGLMAQGSDVTLPLLSSICDVFYIGGTKVGALFGEAVVIPKKDLIPNFFTIIKQHGALLAKGRILGIQFDTLFTDNLYFKISKNAIDRAEEMKIGFHEKGYKFFLETNTNQQFIILENAQMNKLKQKIGFSFWEKYDNNHTVVRFATSFATTKEDVKNLINLL